jgi:methyltransferase-like protein/SAM-dependent methyltransferase
MSSSPTTSYDEVPYESSAFEQTHPDRLATIGHLFGLQSPAVAHCRVLELGCAAGANLIPMAYQMPDARFIGVDLSSTQVAAGRQMIRDLQLDNIRLECADIMQIGPEWGLFDYILCHGVYSWVPDSVRTKILTVCSQNLSPNGIAYVSYNTYPGWHMREMIRHMMLFHSKQFDQPRERIEQARAMIDFMARSVPTANNYYGLMLRRELDLISRSKDSYLFHEHLEEINAPVYFYEFAEHAQRCGLQYLGEANFATMLTSGFPKETHETLNRISPGILPLEQYMDFLRNRQFRQTLLCHAYHSLKRNITSASTDGLSVASAAYPVQSKPDLRPQVQTTFQAPNGATIETNFPLTKAAMQVLSKQWPLALSIVELQARATSLLKIQNQSAPADPEPANRQLSNDLLQSYTVDAIEFHTWQPVFTLAISDKPRCSDLARYLVDKELPVVNQRHEFVRLDPFTRKVALLADGRRNRSRLLDDLSVLVGQEELEIRRQGRQPSDSAPINATVEATLERALKGLARLALLVA